MRSPTMSRPSFLRGALAGVGLTLVAGVAAGAYASRGEIAIVMDRDALTGDVTALNDEIDAIDRLNAQSTDRSTRKKVARRLGSLREKLDAVADRVHQAPELRDHERDHDRDRATLLSDGDFRQLLADLDAAAASDDKMIIVSQAAETALFSSAQVGQVVDHLAFSEDKVNAAALLYPRVTDRAKFTTVYTHLASSADKESLRQRIAR